MQANIDPISPCVSSLMQKKPWTRSAQCISVNITRFSNLKFADYIDAIEVHKVKFSNQLYYF